MRLSTIRFAALIALAWVFMAGCAAAPSSSSSPTAAIPVSAATSYPAAASGSPTSASPATAYPAAASNNPTSSVPATAYPAPSDASSQAAGSASGSIRCVLISGQNVASYSVREQLAKFNFPTDAVGKTSQVSGEIDIQKDGTIDTAKSKFVVDLTSLQTDSPMRDGFVSRNILQTDQYPQAVFVPTKVEGLPTPLPPSGNVSFKISGNLTLHGVTKPVTWDVTGTAQNGSASGTATTSFKFEDFNLDQPHVPVVLSVVDNINLSVSLSLKQQ